MGIADDIDAKLVPHQSRLNESAHGRIVVDHQDAHVSGAVHLAACDALRRFLRRLRRVAWRSLGCFALLSGRFNHFVRVGMDDGHALSPCTDAGRMVRKADH
jgi:hypothetical protein